MSKTHCEIIQQAAMALADGEKAPVNAQEVQSHLSGCPACDRAIRELLSLNRLLDSQSRREQAVDLWPRIACALQAPAADSSSPSQARMLVLMAMALLLVRGVVFASAGPLEWAGRFAGLLFVGGLFLLFRENPFAIQPRLTEAKHTGS